MILSSMRLWQLRQNRKKISYIKPSRKREETDKVMQGTNLKALLSNFSLFTPRRKTHLEFASRTCMCRKACSFLPFWRVVINLFVTAGKQYTQDGRYKSREDENRRNRMEKARYDVEERRKYKESKTRRKEEKEIQRKLKEKKKQTQKSKKERENEMSMCLRCVNKLMKVTQCHHLRI